MVKLVIELKEVIDENESECYIDDEGSDKQYNVYKLILIIKIDNNCTIYKKTIKRLDDYFELTDTDINNFISRDQPLNLLWINDDIIKIYFYNNTFISEYQILNENCDIIDKYLIKLTDFELHQFKNEFKEKLTQYKNYEKKIELVE